MFHYTVLLVCLQTVIWDQVWNFPLETDQPSKGFGPFIILVLRFLNWGYSSESTNTKASSFYLPTGHAPKSVFITLLSYIYIIDWVLQAASCKTEVVVEAHTFNPAIRSRGEVDLWWFKASLEPHRENLFQNKTQKQLDLTKEKNVFAVLNLQARRRSLWRLWT